MPEARCDGHYGPGSLREWAACPLCNPDEPTTPLSPAKTEDICWCDGPDCGQTPCVESSPLPPGSGRDA